MTSNFQLNHLVILGAFLATTYAQYWYDDNKQRCNCLSNIPCNQDGTCTPDECATHYIGVTCQHANVSLLRNSTKQLTIPPVLLDGDDATCLTNPIEGAVIYEVVNPLHFIWIYISSKSTISINPHLTVYRHGDLLSVESTVLEINEKSLLIKLNQDIVYDKLELTNLPKYSCSLVISIGRNLAISSFPSQRSGYTHSTSTEVYAKKVIDGSDDHQTLSKCSLSDLVGDEWWKTRLLHDALLNVIQIVIPQYDAFRCSMQQFVLKLFLSDNTLAHRHNHRHSSQSLEHMITIQVDVQEPVREVEVSKSAKTYLPHCSLQTMVAICEMYIFGEFQCPENMYGPLCERHCLGCSRDACDPDWGCPDGCTKDFIGHWCNKSCLFRYGQQCQFMCPENCGGIGDCDTRTAACLQGCKTGFLPPNCTDPCPPGTFDVNCSRSCDNCMVNDSTGYPTCDPEFGICSVGCEDGYGGDHCEKLKIVGFSFYLLLKYMLYGLGVTFLLIMFYKSMNSFNEDNELTNTQEEKEEEKKVDDGQKNVEAVVDEEINAPSTDLEKLQSEPSMYVGESSVDLYTDIQSDITQKNVEAVVNGEVHASSTDL